MNMSPIDRYRAWRAAPLVFTRSGERSRARVQTIVNARALAPAFLHEWEASETHGYTDENGERLLAPPTHRETYPDAYARETASEALAAILALDAATSTRVLTDKARGRKERTDTRRARHLEEVGNTPRKLLSPAMLAASDANLWHHESAALEQAANALLAGAGYRIIHTDTFDPRTYRMHVIGDPLAMRSTPRKPATEVRYVTDESGHQVTRILKHKTPTRCHSCHGSGVNASGAACAKCKGRGILRIGRYQQRHDGTRLTYFLNGYAMSDDAATRQASSRATGNPVGKPLGNPWLLSARTLPTRWKTATPEQIAAAEVLASVLVTSADGASIPLTDGSSLMLRDGTTVTRSGATYGIRDAARRAALAGALLAD